MKHALVSHTRVQTVSATYMFVPSACTTNAPSHLILRRNAVRNSTRVHKIRRVGVWEVNTDAPLSVPFHQHPCISIPLAAESHAQSRKIELCHYTPDIDNPTPTNMNTEPDLNSVTVRLLFNGRSDMSSLLISLITA